MTQYEKTQYLMKKPEKNLIKPEKTRKSPKKTDKTQVGLGFFKKTHFFVSPAWNQY